MVKPGNNNNNSFIRIVNKIKKEEFINLYSSLDTDKWFSGRELEIYSFPKNADSLAGRYLIKKAISEYLKKNIDNSEIEILNNEFGKPDIIPGKKVSRICEDAGIKKICCSISHSRNIIAGMIILCY